MLSHPEMVPFTLTTRFQLEYKADIRNPQNVFIRIIIAERIFCDYLSPFWRPRIKLKKLWLTASFFSIHCPLYSTADTDSPLGLLLYWGNRLLFFYFFFDCGLPGGWK